MKRIILTVSPSGEVSIQTKGYAGKGCKDASRFLEEALGTKTADRNTADIHLPPTTTNGTNQTA